MSVCVCVCVLRWSDINPLSSSPSSSGIDIDGGTVGIAFIGTMCNLRSSTGVSQDGGRNLAGVATTVAHELGHIFNMDHDDGEILVLG